MSRIPHSPENSEFDPSVEVEGGNEFDAPASVEASFGQPENVAAPEVVPPVEVAPVVPVIPPEVTAKYGEQKWERGEQYEADWHLNVAAREVFNVNGESKTKAIKEQAPEFLAAHEAMIDGFINNPGAAQYLEFKTDKKFGVTVLTLQADGRITFETFTHEIEPEVLTVEDGDDDELGGESTVVGPATVSPLENIGTQPVRFETTPIVSETLVAPAVPLVEEVKPDWSAISLPKKVVEVSQSKISQPKVTQVITGSPEVAQPVAQLEKQSTLTTASVEVVQLEVTGLEKFVKDDEKNVENLDTTAAVREIDRHQPEVELLTIESPIKTEAVVFETKAVEIGVVDLELKNSENEPVVNLRSPEEKTDAVTLVEKTYAEIVAAETGIAIEVNENVEVKQESSVVIVHQTVELKAQPMLEVPPVTEAKDEVAIIAQETGIQLVEAESETVVIEISEPGLANIVVETEVKLDAEIVLPNLTEEVLVAPVVVERAEEHAEQSVEKITTSIIFEQAEVGVVKTAVIESLVEESRPETIELVGPSVAEPVEVFETVINIVPEVEEQKSTVVIEEMVVGLPEIRSVNEVGKAEEVNLILPAEKPIELPLEKIQVAVDKIEQPILVTEVAKELPEVAVEFVTKDEEKKVIETENALVKRDIVTTPTESIKSSDSTVVTKAWQSNQVQTVTKSTNKTEFALHTQVTSLGAITDDEEKEVAVQKVGESLGIAFA